jgi:tight adherence protein C
MLPLILLFVFAAVTMVIVIAIYPLFARTDVIADRLRQIRLPETSRITRRDTAPPGRFGELAIFIGQSVPLTPRSLASFKLFLAQAGYRNPQAVTLFLAVKVLTTMIMVVGYVIIFALLFPGQSYFLIQIILIGFIGFILPNVWLVSKKNKRQGEILYTLPDALDLLTVCIEAGLGLDASLVKITEEEWFSRRALAEEFRVVTQEVRAGKPRNEALRDMAERSGVDDLKSLAASLIQTERLGTSVAQSLRVYSDSLRIKRRQRAEEAAAKTTIKLVFPLALFIFPALLVVILGPAVIRLWHAI